MNVIFGVNGWQSIFAGELNRWAGVSNGKVTFHEHSDGAYNFNASGLAQNDPRFGDIRIGTHRFDGANKTLAHTYFPPPNGATAAGDAHFDQAENWTLASGGLSAPGGGGGGGGGGNLTVGSEQSEFGIPTSLTSPGSASDSIGVGYAARGTRQSDETSRASGSTASAEVSASHMSDSSADHVDYDTLEAITIGIAV
jgi:hypothetical protein